jgi:hypothetical protein
VAQSVSGEPASSRESIILLSPVVAVMVDPSTGVRTGRRLYGDWKGNFPLLSWSRGEEGDLSTGCWC